MKIKSVRIENLRAFKDKTVNFDEYTALIGPNGAGKSTVLFALNVFFQEANAGATSAKVLTKEDFHRQNTTNPIRITVTFGDLPDAAKERLKHYYRQGQVVFTAEATLDEKTAQVNITFYGQRMVIKDFAPYFEAVSRNEKVAALQPIYAGIQKSYAELPKETTGTAMEAALRKYEEEHPKLCELVESPAKPYGFAGAGDRLEEFIQWVYVPAVKEVAQEQQEGRDTAIGKLLARTVRATVDFKNEIDGIEDEARGRYAEMLEKHQKSLLDLAAKLSTAVQNVAHPSAEVELEWAQDPGKAVSVSPPHALVKAREFELEPHLLARCGHGLQRSYLLALLQVLADSEATDAPTLILGIEEAELFQHPPQAKHLARVLQQLTTGNNQVVVTTHSPYFVSAQELESIRLIRRDFTTGEATVAQCTWESIRERMVDALGEQVPEAAVQAAKLAPELSKGLDELFFAQALVLVESHEDAAYVEAHATLYGHSEALRKSGVTIVPVLGKANMLRPLVIAKALNIPVVSMFDADLDCKPDDLPNNEKQNKAIIRACGANDDLVLADSLTFEGSCLVWKNPIPKHVGENWPEGAGEQAWEQARATFGGEGGLNKNPLAVAEFVRQAHDAGNKCELLERVVQKILEFASVAEKPRAAVEHVVAMMPVKEAEHAKTPS